MLMWRREERRDKSLALRFNDRVRCLAISQTVRVELYNIDLLFVYKKLFYSMFHLLLSSPPYIHLMYGPRLAYVFVPNLYE